ncbi:hypothetical protein BOX15_Mlig012514g1 [Macrostomum lignano]|uniref:Uncharacterized protein n=2 Tax=Macrostomum lignano TaxID=282301 RepID=A0A267FQT9_9PLAT|nr:hypothetical protein BOX15_Mlig012514g2 [Macrostomum lignano]PAA93157.1 hypothetical protein BOX15_Mlig012514g1 [Macrostomum lignano]
MSRVNHNDIEGIELCLSWHPASNGDIPAGAVKAGEDCYVARAKHEGEWVPGKLSAGHTSAYVPYGDEEVPYSEYEVLVSSEIGHFGCGYQWLPAKGNSVPKGALVSGYDNGAPLYVARATFEGEVCCGKAQPDLECAYISWGGKEHKIVDDYEVLTMN